MLSQQASIPEEEEPSRIRATAVSYVMKEIHGLVIDGFIEHKFDHTEEVTRISEVRRQISPPPAPFPIAPSTSYFSASFQRENMAKIPSAVKAPINAPRCLPFPTHPTSYETDEAKPGILTDLPLPPFSLHRKAMNEIRREETHGSCDAMRKMRKFEGDGENWDSEMSQSWGQGWKEGKAYIIKYTALVLETLPDPCLYHNPPWDTHLEGARAGLR